MGGESPVVELYDSGGNPLSVQNGTAIPASTPGLLFMGSDGTNSRYITIDGSGRSVIVGAGTAGTATGGVVTIQGIAGGTVVPTSVSGTVTISGTVTANIGTTGGLALDTSVNGILVAQNSTTSGQSGPLIQGAVTTAAPSYTTAKTSPLSLTTAGALRIDGSAVTQPVSGTVTANAGTGNFAVVQATAANLNATVVGTVTANIGTTNGLALDATLTGGTQTTRITDGTNTATVKAASTAAIATDKALVVAISPNNTVGVTGTVTANIGTTNGLALDATLAKLTIAQGTTLGANTQALVGGSVTTASPTYTTGQINPFSLTTAGALRIDGSGTTQPVSGTVAATQSGTWTVQPGNTANTTPWLTTISQGGNSATVTASNALKVDGSAVTQPVSGTVTSNQGTANTLANRWPVIVTDGTNTMPTADVAARAQFDKITDGTNTAAVKAASTAAVATDPALVVAISPNNTVAVTQSTSPWVTNVSQIGGNAITTIAAGEQKVATEGLAANGAAASGNPVLIGGKDDANVARTVRTDPAGDVYTVQKNVPSNATFGNPFGQASGTVKNQQFPLRATTYTEQTTNAQRSIKSTSANDTNTAGTGARQVVITYLDQTGAGPFTETVNLNGTTAVNTVSTTICFIEELHVISAGSTGSNQGTISLFTTTGGGGSAFASIGVGNTISAGTFGDNQTLWAHHYTPTGKTTTISATAIGTNGNQTGNGYLRSLNPTVATSVELQITGTIVLDASSPTISRSYQVPVQIVGPARTTFYGVSGGTGTSFYGVFEYWDA